MLLPIFHPYHNRLHLPSSTLQSRCHPFIELNMSSPITIGLGLLGAGLGGRVLWQMMRGGARAGEQWAKGGFQGKMDRGEAMKVLGLK